MADPIADVEKLEGWCKDYLWIPDEDKTYYKKFRVWWNEESAQNCHIISQCNTEAFWRTVMCLVTMAVLFLYYVTHVIITKLDESKKNKDREEMAMENDNRQSRLRTRKPRFSRPGRSPSITLYYD